MDDATRGTKALSASDFASAIKHFTRALTVNPHATDYYIKRSTAYLRLKPEDGGPDGEAALRDAEMAVALGIRRARRELIIAGQMRRAIVLYHLGRFGDADYLFKILREKLGGVENPNSKDKAMSAMGMTEKATAASEASRKNQELQIWEIKVKSQLNKLESGDDKAKVTIQEVPDLVVPTPEELKTAHQVRLQELERGVAPSASSANVEEIRNTKGMGKTSTRQSQNVVSPLQSEEDQSNKAPANVPTTQTANKVRHEWYQSHDAVVLTLYAKNVPKDKAEIDIQEHSISVTFPTAAGSDFTFDLDPLYAPIDITTSKASIMSTKIEIILKKKQPGQKWSSLEGTPGPIDQPTQSAVAQPPSVSTPAKAPAYPTSARGGAKDWDKVAVELTKKQKKKSENKGEEGKDEEVDSDLEEYNSGDPVDAFFKKLYANADDDTRRAMVKSYYESKGTALSTNWSEVGKGPVEERPPTDD